ncbi:bifunctional [glutamate--ammonia ligase]-adenylyl-L-tyrosine phosphorylase/[glutamate--ammonia-ligase] adenylyltransferase [Chitinilyticum litopenaei]|uniref:bifunctional [glutamate--ammonia ligase]-adenylyl-L-tyrosine phosphorylase/[glutamate--ammonia-ligase] adenylyltransferase n=1 Tax=Chitinilyticum litopenaei TaxID=1121276 RepID=UPI0003F9E64D|nr:bifunctional [glutamate--ammonia ligase]-adenylyl-L-tyrosine phosphorylase/[glutamate--ammonia-ligase] adenylyltransferase [Chitinilyticum litopenaei]
MPEIVDDSSPALSAALAHSNYLRRLFTRRPALAAETAEHLYQPFTRAAMQQQLAHEAPADEEMLKRQLRHLRQAVMARLIARELAGLSDLNEAMHTTTDLAEVAIDAALSWLAQPDERHGEPIGEDSGTVQQLIVVGMGKLGGRELNVSSDIDLIFVYPEDGETSGPRRITNHEYFARLGKRLINLIGDSSDEGFVFRVDMRLRPFGDSGPLVCSFAALENYLLTQGREWERYAWIKGRALSGDAEGLYELVQPFVFRKYLDYGAYHSMRELHSQIRREVQRRDKLDNIKLGPGGIREIEFIGQVFQLIRGGRNKALRQRATQTILRELGAQGTLPEEAVADLDAAYVFLRNLEHRIMYLDDAQTQMLPTSEEDRERIARSMNYPDWAAFRTALDYHRNKVTRQFEQVFAQSPADEAGSTQDMSSLQDDGGVDLLRNHGYIDAGEVHRRLGSYTSSSKYLQMPDRCRRRIDLILPALVETAAAYPNPDTTLLRVLDLIEAVSRRESYLALLAEHPQTLKRLADLYSASSWVSQYLTRHPILLDELLDARLLYQEPDWDRLGRILRSELQDISDDTEAKMDCLRHFQHTQVFRIVAQDLGGMLTLEKVSDHLSALADLILAVTLEEVWKELPGRHTEHPAFAVVGYGKLGGKELGYGSDLDIVFLFDDEHPNAQEVYAKYAKRIVNWLTTLTPAGQLYDIDLRLRPNGASGLLVSSLEAFAEYQQQSAWVWEHQAISRARFAAGDARIGQWFEDFRCQILAKPRAGTALREEVRAMRERMLESHPALDSDVKHVRGGIVDIEFIVQYLILAHAGDCPALTANSGNIALLDVAARQGLIPEPAAEAARYAYRELRRLQHAARLNDNKPSEAMLAPLAGHLARVRALWADLFGADGQHAG